MPHNVKNRTLKGLQINICDVTSPMEVDNDILLLVKKASFYMKILTLSFRCLKYFYSLSLLPAVFPYPLQP
jgi:hypothetical protein